MSDALSVELRPSQIRGLIVEFNELQDGLSEDLEKARDDVQTMASSMSDDDVRPEAVRVAEHALSRAEYALRSLAAMREQLPQHSADGCIVVGPAQTLSCAISGAALSAAGDLADALHRPFRAGEASELRDMAVAALAWVETFLDCQALEQYSFDAQSDHVPRR